MWGIHQLDPFSIDGGEESCTSALVPIGQGPSVSDSTSGCSVATTWGVPTGWLVVGGRNEIRLANGDGGSHVDHPNGNEQKET